MNNAEVLEMLRSYWACEELQKYAGKHGGPLADLWRDCERGDCERGDWMLWLAALAECAELVRAYISAADIEMAYKQREDIDAVGAQG